MRAFNKVTHDWVTTIDGSELTPSNNWILDPTFEDEEFANTIGMDFWTYNGNLIETPSNTEYQATILQRKQAIVWKSIQNERERRSFGGVLVEGNWFHSDSPSRMQHIGLVMFGVNLPQNIQWKTMTGSFVTMTPTLAQQIFQAVASHDIAAFAVAEQHRTQMLAAQDPTTYNFLNNPSWPTIYGE